MAYPIVSLCAAVPPGVSAWPPRPSSTLVTPSTLPSAPTASSRSGYRPRVCSYVFSYLSGVPFLLLVLFLLPVGALEIDLSLLLQSHRLPGFPILGLDSRLQFPLLLLPWLVALGLLLALLGLPSPGLSRFQIRHLSRLILS